MHATLTFHPSNAIANANADNLISVVEDFSPPSLPTPIDLRNKSDGDETTLKSGRSYLFKLISKGSSAAGKGQTQVHPCNEDDA